MSTTADDQSPTNVLGPLATLADAVAGIAIALEIQNYMDREGVSLETAAASIRTSDEFIAAARGFGAIGGAIAGLSGVMDAVIDGGDPSDFIQAGVEAIAGIAGAAAAVAAVGILGVSPLSLIGVAVGILGGIIGTAIAENFIPPEWFDALENLFDPPPIDPLVFDLDGDGVELTSLSGSNAFFDLDGDGFAENTGWVSPDDGLLALDINGNGQIDDISELFGSQTETGYEQLAAHDSNGDGQINAQDAVFSSLLIWQDVNGDGQSNASELTSVTDAGIASISLTATETDLEINGNAVIETGDFEFADGTIGQTAEVLFELSQAESVFTLPEDFSYDLSVFDLPTLRGFGEVPSLWVAMSMDDDLQTSAETLIDTARNGQFSSLVDGFDNFLAEWAGVEDSIWLQDVAGLQAALVFDEDAYSDYRDIEALPPDVNGDGHYNPWPPIVALVFFENSSINDLAPEILAWLDEHDYAAPAFDLQGYSPNPSHQNPDSLPWTATVNPFELNWSADTTVVGGGGTYTMPIQTPMVDFAEDPAPAMEAIQFAFLEALMGRHFETPLSSSLSPGFAASENAFAEDHILIANPSSSDVAGLQESYNDVHDYFMARFLAQAAWSIIQEEGESADLGGLAPFAKIYYNPLTDTIDGDAAAFVTDLINLYRDDAIGTDLEALTLLEIFVGDMPEIPGLVLTLFPDIPVADVVAIFEIDHLTEGDATSETLTLSAESLVIAGAGNDTISADQYNSVIFAGLGDDSLTGGTGADEYVYLLGDGNDTINDVDYAPTRDKLHLPNLNADDVTFSMNADDDLVITFSNSQFITVVDHFTGTEYSGLASSGVHDIELIEFADGTILDTQGIRDKVIADMADLQISDGDDVVTGTYLSELFSAQSGDDIITAGGGSDTLDGGAGNDTLNGGQDGDLYLYSLGDGNDLVIDTSYGPGQDTLRLTDLNAGDVSFDQSAQGDLVVSMADGGTVVVSGHFDGPENAIENVIFANGIQLDEQGLRDRSVSDQKADGATIVGSSLTENYVHTLGNGTYTIVDTSYGMASDRLLLTDVLESEATFLMSEGGDLVVALSNGETITITDHFDGTFYSGLASNGISDIERIEFADGTVLNVQDIRDKMIADTAASQSTDGDDTVNGTYFSDVINAGDGDDSLLAGAGADTLMGGLGNDTLNGGDGADVYHYALGDGNDLIVDASYQNHIDTLVLSGLTPDDVLFSRGSGDDLLISLPDGAIITIEDHFGGSVSDMERIEFSDGTLFGQSEISDKAAADFIASQISAGDDSVLGSAAGEIIDASDGNDTIDGAGGDDQLIGGAGDDLLLGGAGADSFDGGAGVDTLDLSSSTDALNIDLSLSTSHHADGTVKQVTNIENVVAGSGADALIGSDASNVLTGNEGDDTLAGGSGSDTYVYTLGDGSDTIRDYAVSGGTDRLHLTDLNAADVTLSTNAQNDLLISLSDGATIAIENHFNAASESLEEIEFADGTVLDAQGIQDKFDVDTAPPATTRLSAQVEAIRSMSVTIRAMMRSSPTLPIMAKLTVSNSTLASSPMMFTQPIQVWIW